MFLKKSIKAKCALDIEQDLTWWTCTRHLLCACVGVPGVNVQIIFKGGPKNVITYHGNENTTY